MINNNGIHSSVYIGTGDKRGFYTLHRIISGAKSGGEFWHDNYIQNLSTEWEKADEKARAYAEACGAVYYPEPFELDGFTKLHGHARWAMILDMIDGNEIPVGKFRGESIDSIIDDELEYFAWMLEEFNFNKDEFIPFRVRLATLFADRENPRETARIAEQARQEREQAIHDAAEPVPETDARIKFTGTVLAVKWRDNDFGGGYKMLFRDDRGFKLWGTALTIDGDIADKGDQVEFMATVEQSDDDAKFGFFKRPTKKRLVKAAE